MSGKENFTWAFKVALRANPDVAPGPTVLNTLLGRAGIKMNSLNGRENMWRTRLLLDAGFRKDEKGMWVK